MATTRQKKAVKEIVENRGSVSAAMRKAGYSAKTAKNPKNLTDSEAWKQLMREYLDDKDLAKKHEELLNSTKVEHMVFPLGPADEADEEENLDEFDDEEFPKHEAQERTSLTDQEIIDMLADVNCKVKKIVHGRTARHVYFWVMDPKARKEALDMAYKLKGKYAPEKVETTNAQAEEDRIILRDLIRSFRKK